ncbi:hypothetical protein D3C80_1364250 [compost metagenome]
MGEAQRQHGVIEEDERQQHGEGGEEHQQEDPQSVAQIVPEEDAAQRRGGVLVQASLPASELLVATDLGQQLRQRIADRQQGRRFPLRQQAQLLQQPQGAAALGQGGDEVDDGIDHAPGDVAADAGDQQLLDLRLPRLQGVEAAGEGEHHQQAEQDLGVAGDGIEGGKAGLAHGRLTSL